MTDKPADGKVLPVSEPALNDVALVAAIDAMTDTLHSVGAPSLNGLPRPTLAAIVVRAYLAALVQEPIPIIVHSHIDRVRIAINSLPLHHRRPVFTTSALIERLQDMVNKEVYNALTYLTSKGELERVGYGRYIIKKLALVMQSLEAQQARAPAAKPDTSALDVKGLVRRLHDTRSWLAELDYPGVGTAMSNCSIVAEALLGLSTPAEAAEQRQPVKLGPSLEDRMPSDDELKPVYDDVKELVRRLREIESYDFRFSFLAHTSDTAREAANVLSSQNDVPTGVKSAGMHVKPLEWKHFNPTNVGPEEWVASGVCGFHAIISNRGNARWQIVGDDSTLRSLEAQQVKVQADYERSILSVVIPDVRSKATGGVMKGLVLVPRDMLQDAGLTILNLPLGLHPVSGPAWEAVDKAFRVIQDALAGVPMGALLEPSALAAKAEEALCTCGAGQGEVHTTWCDWVQSSWAQWGRAFGMTPFALAAAQFIDDHSDLRFTHVSVGNHIMTLGAVATALLNATRGIPAKKEST